MTDAAFYSSPVGNRPLPFLATAFHFFDAQHGTALIIISVFCALVAKAAGRQRPSVNKCLRGLLGSSLIGYIAFFYVQQGIEGALTWEYSMPLDLCSLVLILCLISLLRPNRFIAEAAYFLGMGGILQALATPDLANGFPSVEFILFFWGHGTSLATITFLIMDRDFRPGRRSVLRMMMAVNFYALVIGAVDAITGWNYGYLCRKPFAPSLLDYLGPWPWYLLSLELIALLTFLILYVPWRFKKQEPGDRRQESE